MLKQLLLFSLLAMALAFPNSKVEPRLASSLRSNGVANIFVKFGHGNGDIIQSVNSIQFASRGEKGTHLVAALKSRAETSQKVAVSICQSSSVHFKVFWVSNELYVKGASQQLINQLEALPEVSRIKEERVTQIDDLPVSGPITQEAIWNLEKIEAPGAWGLPGGNDGQGVVVANIDTGVRHTHEALRNNFRADYGWFDAAAGRLEPYDNLSHGTHCMATKVGAGVGVAPGAQWIACQACPDYANCEQSAFMECGQWMICPTLANGTNPDCSKAPNVVSNSWGFMDPDDDFYDDIISAWKALNIIPVFGSGNEGPTCDALRNPGNKDVITAGATNINDTLASWSSPGPAANNTVKPDISAPGQDIYSAYSDADNSYGLMSGTSMATPHVAGAVALLLSRNPSLNYEQVKELLIRNTDTRSLSDLGRACGGRNSTDFPNNHYGYGRLNARSALEAAINNF